MKVGKFRAIALSILCCLLLNVTGCSYITGDNAAPTATPSPEATSQLTVAQAKENLTRAEDELEKFRQQAKDIEKTKDDTAALRKAADAAKIKADGLRAATRGAGKNPDDENEAPITYKATQDWREADDKAAKAEENLKDLPGAVARATTRVEKARQALQEAQQREQGTATPEPSRTAGTNVTEGNPVLPFWLPLLLSVLLLLVVAEGALGFLLFRSVADDLKDIKNTLGSAEKRLELLGAKQPELPSTLNAQPNNTQQLSVELSRLQTSVSKMESVLTAIAYTVQNIRQSSQGTQQQQQQPNYASEESVATPAAGRNVIEFPITAEDYHSRVASDLVPVSHDFLRKMLVKAADGEGVMLLVDDGSAPGNMNYVVPQHKRFQSKSDFMHYSDYFDCPNPSAGEITIIRPAIVSRASGGWQLHDRGVLRV